MTTQPEVVKKKKTKVILPVKKVKKKVSTETSIFDVSNIIAEMKGYNVEVMGADTEDKIPYTIPFSNEALQKITGGIIGGKFVEISGDSSSGKSFLLYDLMKNCIDMGGTVFLCDTEIAFDPAYGRRIGLKKGASFLYTTDNNIRTLFAASRKFISSVRAVKRKIPIIIAVDSFAGLKHPDAIKHAEAGEDKGYEAMQKNAYFSQKLDGFVGLLKKYDVTFILINQTREDHTVMYGDSTYTLGENVIKFWCTQRLRGRLGAKDKIKVKSLGTKEKKKQVGITAIWETIKNRRIEPFQNVSVKVNYSTGMRRYSGLGELLTNEGLIVPATKTIAMLDKNGEPVLDSKKKPKKEVVKVLKVKTTGLTYHNVKEVIAAHPEFLEPKRIDSMVEDDIDDDIDLEDNEND